MENISYDLKLDKHPVFPIFTSSLTIETTAPEEKWMSADDVVKTLTLEGVIVSKQTLFNKERAGVLTTKRQSARKVFFNVYEARRLFNIEGWNKSKQIKR